MTFTVKPASSEMLRPTGFTLIELVIVMAVIAGLTGVLINRVQPYQEQAEKAAMEQTLGTIRSALHLQIASRIAKGKVNEIPALAEQNPMDWLAEKPKNYLGAYYAPKQEDVVSGHWTFDLKKRSLIYSVQNTAHFHSKGGTSNQIHFQVKLVTNPKVSSRKIEELNAGDIEGVILEPVFPYTWF